SRLPRLLRALQTMLLAVVRTITAPAWTRDFFAYVYTYRPLPYNSRIRTVTLSEVIPDVARIPIELRKCFPQHGNMTGEEIILLCVIVRWAKPSRIFEFGTFNGNTTLQLAANAGPSCEV